MTDDNPDLLYTTEARTLTVKAYRDDHGHPTCCANWNTARCQFLMVRKFGFVDVCGLTIRDIHRERAGWLRPVDECPVWHNSQEEGKK